MTPAVPTTIGVDFGTTNTVVSLGYGDGHAELVLFPAAGEGLFAFRSCLSFHAGAGGPQDREIEAGPWAIDAYVEDPLETRFVQSFKSFAASASFTETQILGRRYRFEDLLSTFLLRLRGHAGGTLDQAPPRLIVGRPVRFVGGSPDAALALDRYETAFRRLGFTDIRYAYEPVAAAFFFARQLAASATVLVADFGGGTSDFSLIRFEREGGRVSATALGQAGVGLAGDAFDYRILDNIVSPELGKGSRYRAFDNVLPVPNRYFTAFARWEQLALMRQSRDMRDIRALVRTSLEPEKIGRLVEVLDENYSYQLYRSVSQLKEALSSQDQARFLFEAGDIHIARDVARAEFEGWIAPELAAMEAAVDEALAKAGLGPDGVDRVFLTGGTSLTPAVRRLFTRRFGAERVESGAELESIAAGLSLIGGETDLDQWSERAPASAGVG